MKTNKNFLKSLALVAGLSATQSTAQQSTTHDEKIDCKDFKLTESLYRCHPNLNPHVELKDHPSNTHVEWNILPEKGDCVPLDQYTSIFLQLQECMYNIAEPSAADSTIAVLNLKYKDCQGENKELKARLKRVSSELSSTLTTNLNLESLTKALQFQANPQATDLNGIVTEPTQSVIGSQELAKHKIVSESEDTTNTPVVTDQVYLQQEIRGRKTSYTTPRQVSQPLGNSLGISVYNAGIGLNANLDDFTFGLGVIKANKDGTSSLMTKTIENEPAPDFRTVYTERASMKEENDRIAFFANVGYNFSKRFSLSTGLELTTRKTSGEQRNTIEHYLDNTRLSEVSEVVPRETETETIPYLTFGARAGLSDRLSLEGMYSTSGQFLAGINFKIGGKK